MQVKNIRFGAAQGGELYLSGIPEGSAPAFVQAFKKAGLQNVRPNFVGDAVYFSEENRSSLALASQAACQVILGFTQA